MVEFAFVLPILLLLLFGTIEFGRIFSATLVLHNSAREGARAGVTGGSDSQIISIIQSSSSTLDSARLNITINPTESLRVRGEELRVTISYPLTITVPVISAITGNTVNVGAASVMRIE